MKASDFTVTIEVEQTPAEAFDAINNVRGWWSENIGGSTKNLNDEFVFRSGEFHVSRQKLTEVIPGKRIVWSVSDSKLSFVKNKKEWDGTKIVFEISKRNDKTLVKFTHQGLVPPLECYDACSNAWGSYVRHSLLSLIATGEGQPELKE